MATAPTPIQRTNVFQADIPQAANMKTLPSDVWNQLAAFGGLGYQPAAFDYSGNDSGYYGYGTYIRSPLMQKYLQPTAQNQTWLPNALNNAMPGWNAVSNPGGLNYFTASQTPAPLVPTNQPGGMQYNPADLPGVNGRPIQSMWNQTIGAQNVGIPQQQMPGSTGTAGSTWNNPFTQQLPQRPPQQQMQQQSAGNPFVPGDPFYQAVQQVLGSRQMAQPGQPGYNLESSPNSRSQAAQWAQQMQQALGRQLSRDELARLNQRAQGWGFTQNTWNPSQADWGQLNADIFGK